eukprot:CAMPEP_0119127748 /NCGR_PEP_ID=MMETSP1310-20130426/6172_1 /TAXON_ID=464262 /ORGANISM="Genus nov. species nov., Strain RCC2339" /LENGTH=271 /DNA_ID=CAMNT_0007118027 /DNA_START=137 /DNA_END=952 /DNA_ORIENTATION=-
MGDSVSAKSSVSALPNTNEPTFMEELRMNSAYQRVSCLLHWSDPIETFLVFGIINFFFFLVTIGGYTFLVLACYLALCFLLACGIYVNGNMLQDAMNKRPTIVNPLKKQWVGDVVHFHSHDIEQIVQMFVLVLNRSITLLREIYSCTDNLKSMKFALFLTVLSIIGQIFSGESVAYFVIVGLFVIPKLYQKKPKTVNSIVGKVMSFHDRCGAILLGLMPKPLRTWMVGPEANVVGAGVHEAEDEGPSSTPPPGASQASPAVSPSKAGSAGE